MYKLETSPIKDVSFGDGMKISLDNYYDILNQKIGGLGSKEYLQLKLVADTVDISDETGANGYKWFSYYNLLERSDLALEPQPISDTILTGAIKLADVYGKFLRKLRTLVVYSELSQDDKDKLDTLDIDIERLKEMAGDLFIKDFQNWKKFCDGRGYDMGDQSMYVQWSSRFGSLKEIETITNNLAQKYFQRKTILNRKYPNADDQEIVDAEFDFDNPSMRLRYPTMPDYEYSVPLTAEYLANLPAGSTALYDDRRMFSWDKTPKEIKTSQVGKFNAEFDKNTEESHSIRTDWSGSGSAGYGFIKVKAGTSGYKSISEEFKKATSLKLSAESTMKLNIRYGSWFKPNLFNHTRVKENPEMFKEFFGENGSLRYYPLSLILIRGFGISFKTSSSWKYDYVSHFKASGGGGFRAFGVNFGGKAKYSRHEEEHKIDQSTTELTISDDVNSIRFIGYVVKKNEPLKDAIDKSIEMFKNEE